MRLADAGVRIECAQAQKMPQVICASELRVSKSYRLRDAGPNVVTVGERRGRLWCLPHPARKP